MSCETCAGLLLGRKAPLLGEIAAQLTDRSRLFLYAGQHVADRGGAVSPRPARPTPGAASACSAWTLAARQRASLSESEFL